MRRTDQRRAAVFICYQRDVTQAQISELIDRGMPTEFTRELVEGVAAHQDDLDELIEEHAIDWSMERIALERAICASPCSRSFTVRTSLDEVAIDEAVETAKLYCGVQAPGFVNGISEASWKRSNMPEEAGRLVQISEQLDATARMLRDADLDGAEATRLAGEPSLPRRRLLSSIA